jgi:hypothetical protein
VNLLPTHDNGKQFYWPTDRLVTNRQTRTSDLAWLAMRHGFAVNRNAQEVEIFSLALNLIATNLR